MDATLHYNHHWLDLYEVTATLLGLLIGMPLLCCALFSLYRRSLNRFYLFLMP